MAVKQATGHSSLKLVSLPYLQTPFDRSLPIPAAKTSKVRKNYSPRGEGKNEQIP